jgi:hypothetical protein
MRGKYELIKIPRENSAYVSRRTQLASLLTRLKPHSYRKATIHQNRVRILKSKQKYNQMQAKHEHNYD